MPTTLVLCRFVIVAAAAAALSSPSTQAQSIITTAGEDLVGAAVTTYTVHHILDDIDAKVAQWEGNAGIIGNNVAQTVIGQLQADAERLRSDLKADLDNVVGQLNADIQTRVLQLVQATNEFEQQLKNDVSQIVDQSVSDLRAILYNVPFVGEGFHIQRVDGTLVRPDDPANHVITVTGNGFGFPSENIPGTTSYLLIQAASNQEPLRVDGVPKHAEVTQFEFPTATFLGLLPNDAPTSITIHLVLDMTERKRVCIFTRKNVQSHYDIPISLVMLPKNGGKVNVTITAPVFQWVQQPNLTLSQTKTTPNGNSAHGNHFWTDWDINTSTSAHVPAREGDQHIWKADITRIDENGHSGAAQFNNHTINLSADRTNAHLTWENWSWPVSITFSAFIEVWTHTSDQTNALPALAFPLGGNFELHLPEGFTNASVLVTKYDGSTETFSIVRQGDVYQPPAPAGHILTFLDYYHTATDIVFVFRSLEPAVALRAYTTRGAVEYHLPAGFRL